MEIDKLSENKWFAHGLPQHKPGAVTQDMVKAKVDYLAKCADSVHILNADDAEGIQKASEIKAVVTRVLNTSETERKGWKNRVDSIYKHVFGPLETSKKKIVERQKEIEAEVVAKMEKEQQAKNELWQKRHATLVGLGMVYNEEADELQLESVRMSRLMVISSPTEELKAYLVKHVLPISNRLKKEREDAAKAEIARNKAKADEIDEALYLSRIARLQELGLKPVFEEGKKHPAFMQAEELDLLLSEEAIRVKTADEFSLTLTGIEMLKNKKVEQEQKDPTVGSKQVTSIPASNLVAPTGSIHRSTEGGIVDSRKDVININYLVNKARELAAKAETDLEGEEAKHAAKTYVEKLRYAADYLGSVLKETTRNAPTK